MFVEESEVPRVEMLPGFWRQTLVHGDDLMLVLFRMAAGAELTAHRHVHEQLGFVINGDVELSIAGTPRRTPPGSCYFVDSNRLHHADVLASALVIDAFSPPRSDYLPDAPERFAAPSGDPVATGGRSAVLHSEEVVPEPAAPGVARRRLLAGRQMAMSLLALDEGAVLAPVAPDVHERAGYVVSGTAVVTVDGTRRRCDAGASFLARRGRALGLAAEDGALVVLADADGGASS